MPEFVARIESLIRRSEGIEQRIEVGDLPTDVKSREVTRQGEPLHPSKTLFEILVILMRESPNVVTGETLERDIWGDDLLQRHPAQPHVQPRESSIDRSTPH